MEQTVTIMCSDVGVRSLDEELELTITADEEQLEPIADDVVAGIIAGRY